MTSFDPPPPPPSRQLTLPLEEGHQGEVVRDLQRRLNACGLRTPVDGLFGPDTTDALNSFQSSRGLMATGSCDSGTWAALVESGFTLGDRLLYLTRPMTRGDDVSQLQQRLGGLGFDAGRIDGIFGRDTDGALREFQRNSGLTVDGVSGPATLHHLNRLGPRIDRPAAVAGVRERERLRSAPRNLHQRKVMVSHGGGVDAIAHALARSLGEAGAEVVVIQHRDPSAIARQANEFASELLIDLEVGDAPTWCAYYRSGDFESTGGRRLAEIMMPTLIGCGLTGSPARGMRLPTLRESRMPAVMVHIGPTSEAVTNAAAITTACATAIEAWIRDPLDPEP
jgi:N-acetylmuramoyl-L-alanine amidase